MPPPPDKRRSTCQVLCLGKTRYTLCGFMLGPSDTQCCAKVCAALKTKSLGGCAPPDIAERTGQVVQGGASARSRLCQLTRAGCAG